MKEYLCEMHGGMVPQVQDHHVIPYRFSQDDSESNMMRVCPKCHKKADTNFVNLIMYQEMNVSKETTKRTSIRYYKKYQRSKTLFYLKLQKRTYYKDMLRYNIKTGEVNISPNWVYRPYNYRNDSIKSHACLSKAASAKGQTRLGV